MPLSKGIAIIRSGYCGGCSPHCSQQHRQNVLILIAYLKLQSDFIIVCSGQSTQPQDLGQFGLLKLQTTRVHVQQQHNPPAQSLYSPLHRPHGDMLFRGTERNQCGIFRKMLKRGTVVSTTTIDIVADLWKG